jgi:hypothetical protein
MSLGCVSIGFWTDWWSFVSWLEFWRFVRSVALFLSASAVDVRIVLWRGLEGVGGRGLASVLRMADAGVGGSASLPGGF